MMGLTGWEGLVSSGVDGGELLIRATVILGVASLVGAALWKGAATVRHGLWTTTFVVLLGLPLATLTGIGWRAPVLPASADPALPTLAVEVPQTVATERPGDAASTSGETLEKAGETTATKPGASTEAAVAASGTTGSRAFSRAPELKASGLTALWWLWAAGTAGALLSLVLGVGRARGVVRRAHPVDDPAWSHALLRSRDRVGVSRRVRLLESAEISTPMTAGWLRPVVLLPEGTRLWSAERRDMVLTHELVHIRRFDAVRQVLGQLALAPYWFHPLSWLASRLALATRERACDEAVLALGARPSRYAGHLLDIAQDAGATPVFAALPMVQPSQLEKRIMAILGSATPRDSVWKTTLTSLFVFGLGAIAATVQPVPLGSQAVGERPDALEGTVSLRVDPGVEGRANATRPEVPAQEAEPLVIRGSILTTVATPAQEMRCDIETLRGNFSGSYSSRSTGTELSGWHNGDRIIQRHVDGTRLCLRVHGDAVFDDDGRGVRAISDDGWVAMESDDGTLARLVITEGPGGMNYAWSVDGDERAYDADAQQWTEDMFAVLDGLWEMSRLRGQVSSLRGKISSHRGHVSSLRGQISSHRGHVSSLRGQISSHRGRVSSMQGEIASLNGQVSSMSGQIASHRGQIASLRSAARATSDAQTRARLDDEIAEYEQRIEAVRREIEQFELERRVGAQERRIEDYDVEGRVAELQEEIDEYELEGRIAAIEREIEEFDLEGKIAGVEREIEDLDADRRIAEMERELEPALERLRRSLRQIR